jgi:hypothetical protein
VEGWFMFVFFPIIFVYDTNLRLYKRFYNNIINLLSKSKFS